jgi:hypothetical protein
LAQSSNAPVPIVANVSGSVTFRKWIQFWNKHTKVTHVVIEGNPQCRAAPPHASCSASIKGVITDDVGGWGEYYLAQPAAFLKGAPADGSQRVGQCNRQQTAAAVKGNRPDAVQHVRQFNLAQLAASEEAVITYLDQRFWQCNPDQAAAVGEGT